MEPGSDIKPAAPSAQGPRRLLLALVIGIVVLNLLIFLATMRPGADQASDPDGGRPGVESPTNAP